MTEKLLGIRWENGRPFNIKTETEEGYERGYDVGFSKKDDQYYIHESGHGGEGHENFSTKTGNLETLDDFIDLFHAGYGRLVYCEKCESHIKRDALCEHLEWDGDHSIVVDEEGNEV